MLSSIIDFYNKEINTIGMAFKKTNWMFLIWILSFWGSGIFEAVNYYYYSNRHNKLVILTFLISITYFFIVCNIMKKLKLKYDLIKLKINREDIKSNVNIEYDRVFTLMKRYLMDKNLYTEKKLEIIISLLNDEVKRKEPPAFIAPSIVISIVVPIWAQVLNKTFSDIADINIIINFAASISVLIIFFIFFFWSLKVSMKGTVKGIIYPEIYELKRLIRLMNDLLLSCSESKEV